MGVMQVEYRAEYPLLGLCGMRAEKEAKGKFKTLIPGFDELFSEGIPFSSSVLVEGGPGSGKTVFCLQLALNACRQGYRTLYMSFEEPEEKLLSHFEVFGWNAGPFIKKNLLQIKRFSALDIARSVEALLSEAKKELLIEVNPVLIPAEFKPQIVLIDSLTAISSAFSGEEYRFRIYMEQLFRYLEKNNITSFLIRETSRPTHLGLNFSEKGEAVSFLSDGIISMYSLFKPDGVRERAIEILKMRGEEIKRKIVKMEIKNKKGIVVYPQNQISKEYTLT